MINYMFVKKAIICISLLLCFSSCEKNKTPKAPTSFPISVDTVQQKTAFLYIDTIGHVQPLVSVDIRSRVEGQLEHVYFKEGQNVKKDSLLFLIDPAPFQAELDKSKALLLENLANLQLSKDTLKRYVTLIPDDYVSQLNIEQYQTEVLKNEALVAQNEATIEEAKLNLSYCQIASPVDGKTGILQIDQGNLIAPNSSTPLITINQITPIYATFSVPEKNLPTLKEYNKKGSLEIHVAFEQKDLEKKFILGKINLLDNTVNTQTGMIKLRAIFPNEDTALWPGQYLQVRVVLTPVENALIIPFQAVQLTTSGPVVFVVKEDNTVDMKPVTLGQRQDENIIVTKGVRKEDKIVIKGLQNLSQGAHIFIPETKKETKSS